MKQNIDIKLGNYNKEAISDLLLEKRVDFRFGVKRKIYYYFLRNSIGIPARKVMQNLYGKKNREIKSLCYTKLIDLMKSDEKNWENFKRAVYPENYETAIVLTHDVETKKGYDFIRKVAEVEKQRGFTSCWNFVVKKYPIEKEFLDELVGEGFEIGLHGFNHDGLLYSSKDVFSKRAVEINRALKEYNAVGFRSPMVHRNLFWLQELDILWDSSCFDYDPYQPFPGGTGCIWPFMAGKFVELPYTLFQDHTLFYVLKEKSIDIWKKKIDWLLENRGMILVLTHPDYLREKDYLKYYVELLDYISEIKNAWRCLPKTIAKFVMGNGVIY